MNGMSECHKSVDNYIGSHITVWIPRCAGREAFDGVEPLHGFNIFGIILEARAEILKNISLVFWSKRCHPKDILKLIDL